MQVFNTMDLCKEPSDKNSRFSLTWKSAPKKKKDGGGGLLIMNTTTGLKVLKDITGIITTCNL